MLLYQLIFWFSLALSVSTAVRGTDVETRLLKRNVVRYSVLSQALVFRDISLACRRWLLWKRWKIMKHGKNSFVVFHQFAIDFVIKRGKWNKIEMSYAKLKILKRKIYESKKWVADHTSCWWSTANDFSYKFFPPFPQKLPCSDASLTLLRMSIAVSFWAYCW
jgi:hypothetical protein